jgi:hypothetical protein
VAAFAQSPTSRPVPQPKKHTTATGYEVRGNKVYYGRTELRDADYRTFEALGHGYAKDRNNVWWQGSVLPYVDAKSFRLVTQTGKPDPAPGYGPVPPPMGPSGPPAGHGHGPVPGGHEVFMRYEVIGSTVYYNGVKVKGARASSFKDLGWGYAMDTFDVYYCGKEIDASTMNFEVLTDGYAKNAFDVFYFGEEVKGASPSSFKVLSNGYAKDSFDTFYKGQKIDD